MMEFLKRNMKWWLLPLCVIVFLFLTVFGIFWMPNSFPDPAGKIVTIPRGASFKSVVDSLNTAGVIRSVLTFKTAGRILGMTRSVKVGKYLFQSGLSNGEILRDLAEGKSRMILQVVIPEGWKMTNIARRYSHELGVDEEKFLTICRDSAFVHSQGFEGNTLEGYLLPDTYNFYWQTDEREIIDRMIEGFKQFYVDSLKEQQEKMKLSLHKVLTLASIVEGESGIDEERPMIAGVYWNRLKRNMKLEADPTVQYVIPDGPRRLLYRDLKYPSPYNTYLNYGLPPGPVNNPGKKSIIATLFPEKHQYLFFVATGVGGHRFSKNLNDHQKAVRGFRKIRRELERNGTRG